MDNISHILVKPYSRPTYTSEEVANIHTIIPTDHRGGVAEVTDQIDHCPRLGSFSGFGDNNGQRQCSLKAGNSSVIHMVSCYILQTWSERWGQILTLVADPTSFYMVAVKTHLKSWHQEKLEARSAPLILPAIYYDM